MSNSQDEYCGLDCAALLERLDDILSECKTHEQYDPEFAPKMVQKLIDRCIQVKADMKEYERMRELFALP